MTVNGKDSVNNIATASLSMINVFSWEKEKLNENANTKYELEISLDSLFYNIIYTKRDILDSNTKIVRTEIDYTFTEQGKLFYWRIRPYIGTKFGDYSIVAKFRTNTLPGIPRGLYVKNRE